MKKICLLILMFIMFVPLVKAETKEEMQTKVDNFLEETFSTDIVELNSINPNDYNDNQTIEYFTDFIENEYYKDGIITSFEFKENYTKATVRVFISLADGDTVEKTKEVNIKWKETNNNYKSKISDIVKKYGNDKIDLLDIYTIKHYKDGGNENKVIRLNEFINDNKISYKLDWRGGDSSNDWKESGLLGFYYLFYDNILYGVVEGGYNPFNIIYIPQDTKETKEDYVNVAQTRVNKYYPDLKLENSSKTFIENEDIAKFIDMNINSSFNPVPVDININGKNYSFIIVKGTSTQLTINIPSEFKNNSQDNSSNQNNNNNNNNNQEINNPNSENNNNNNNKDEIENPATGAFIPTISLMALLLICCSLLIVAKKKKKIYKV